MKTLELKHLFSVAAAALAVVACAMPLSAVAQSANLVDWQGSYIPADRTSVTSTRESSATALSNSEFKGLLYAQNNNTAISPYAANYSGTSATFYGAAHQITHNLDATRAPQLRAVSNADWNGRNRIFVESMPGLGASGGNPAKPSLMRGFFYWKKSDFLGASASSGQLSLSDIDSFYLNVPGGRVNSASIRFVVQSGDKWYLSEAELRVGSAQGNIGSLTLDQLSSSQWGEWVVQDSASSLINSAPQLFNIGAGALNDITAVGFYFDAGYNFSNTVNLGFDQFTVAVVPEPSSVALLGGIAILVFVLCARRRG